ncbi:MAG: M1 family metallopeptidase [Cyclobacteriaceae bacterium]
MRKVLSIFFFLSFVYSHAQISFNRADTLRGGLSKFRVFDVTYYVLKVKVFPETKSIAGSNSIFFELKNSLDSLQIDLYENMEIDSIIWRGEQVRFTREYNAVWLNFSSPITAGNHFIIIYYHGRPVESERPPWDGGFVWKTDSTGQPWVTVACQGAGASLWWPNKDHLSDEPDSMRITATVPEKLICVANGTLENVFQKNPGWKTYHWKISYPINNYNVTLNIADYSIISDVYITAEMDSLPLDYYVMPFNQNKAENHFVQVKEMLSCFEKYFGPYPFINDGYKLIETPYLGMEHQSAIAYGNKYINNEFGFDFIIVHESGHEYWGNSISAWDNGQMWIHEAFTTYMESLLVECRQDYQTAIAYLETQKPLIKNEMAIEQPVGINFNHWNDADMYYKGTWMLHTIRNIVDDDDKWFNLLRQLYETYKISIVNSNQITQFIDRYTTHDLAPVFEQYLRRPNPPVLQYYWQQENNNWKLYFRWHEVVEDFKMPVKFKTGNQTHTIVPTRDWQSGNLKNKNDFSWATQLYYFIPQNVKEDTKEQIDME